MLQDRQQKNQGSIHMHLYFHSIHMKIYYFSNLWSNKLPYDKWYIHIKHTVCMFLVLIPIRVMLCLNFACTISNPSCCNVVDRHNKIKHINNTLVIAIMLVLFELLLFVSHCCNAINTIKINWYHRLESNTPYSLNSRFTTNSLFFLLMGNSYLLNANIVFILSGKSMTFCVLACSFRQKLKEDVVVLWKLFRWESQFPTCGN